jgi:hypothetical protein
MVGAERVLHFFGWFSIFDDCVTAYCLYNTPYDLVKQLFPSTLSGTAMRVKRVFSFTRQNYRKLDKQLLELTVYILITSKVRV